MHRGLQCRLPLFLLTIFMWSSSCSPDQTSGPATPKEPDDAVKTYFLDIAFGNEFGSRYTTIRKWREDVRLYVVDTSYAALYQELKLVIGELNRFNKSFQIRRVNSPSEANYTVYFGPGSTYAQQYEPSASNAVANNWGLFWIYWNGQQEIFRGSMYVDVVRTQDPACQRHLLREELTQSLGLMNDSSRYDESIFQQKWTCTTSYAPIDSTVLTWFLDPRISAGMTEQQVKDLISGW
ncbi:MAG: DUF2927 domain-containing protein [Lewinellaceae bacterium]|nr:DUF2927 domain-containing protein [Lewinellaceae bacterium]